MTKVFIISFLIALVSCGAKNDGDSSKKNTENVRLTSSIKDSVIKEIPSELNDSLYRQASNQLEQMMGITSIENGFNEFQIRIWFYYNDRDTQQTIIFKRQNSTWAAEFYSVVLNIDKAGKLQSLSKRVEIKTPKSGWTLFIDSLERTGIESLQDYSKIKGYNASNDPDAVTVELATPKLYRTYQYPTFDPNKSIFPDPRKLEQALTLIKRQFNFKRSDNL